MGADGPGSTQFAAGVTFCKGNAGPCRHLRDTRATLLAQGRRK